MTVEQKNQLENWVRAPSTPQKIVLRAHICLLAHEGLPNRRISQDLKTSRPTVILWRNHFLKSGVAGLEHEPSRKTSSQRTEEDRIKAIVEATTYFEDPSIVAKVSTGLGAAGSGTATVCNPIE